MLKLPVYNQEGKETENVTLNDKAFSIDYNPALVHQVAVTLRNNKRVSAAHTKTKGEVRGGGKKPWKQKGTGRARAGSIRSPIWKGGGVTFGPRNSRNYRGKINKNVGKLVFGMVMGAKIQDEEIKAIQSFENMAPKAKVLINILANLDLLGQSILIITAKKQENLIRAGGNLPQISIINAASVSTLDLLSHKFALIEKEAVDLLEKRLLKDKTLPDKNKKVKKVKK